ncbi:NAD/FAD-dependent oxidoreductase [Nocardioides currus]|uniref:NAD/FAD-dependent oxidoreductase n=1 Tax=Nocardioides currus TaxID=2133958 RepID=A0A2R7Z1K5_9ACTN|nr:NAD/FAD-dependent oxidoreductase [Nocardioides currus]
MVVVGAGIAGVACARELAAAGVPVRVVDRGHRPGGRMASRRLSERPVDLGASYLTVSGPDFAAVVAEWQARGLAEPWTDTFCALGTGEPATKSGPMRWGAPRGLRSLVEDLASGLDVERLDVAEVAELADPSCAAVVLAMPDPQARRLLAPGHPLASRLDREFEPVLALAASWSGRAWDDVAPSGRFDGAFVDDDPVLAWVADDGRRRGDDAPVLVAHSTPGFARRHLEDPGAAGPELVHSLRTLMDLPEPSRTHVHRWTFARPVGERVEPYALVEGPDGLVGACGDGWGPAPKVETAWSSGRALGVELARRLG